MRLSRTETTQNAMAPKPSLLPLLLAALGGGAVALLLSQFRFSMWIEPSTPKDTTPPVIEVAPDPVEPTPISSSFVKPQPPLVNGLRVRNLSPYPVRVVLMPQQAAHSNAPSGSYRAPVHWDFDPNEGSKTGLLLSLPEGNFTLKTGDVLVAFALDGSRHYWGPYIVGKTKGLSRSAASEWQFIIKP